jgi:hypothetical protein
MPVASLPCPLMSTDPSGQPMKHDEKIMINFLLPSLILSLLLLLLLPVQVAVGVSCFPAQPTNEHRPAGQRPQGGIHCLRCRA